MVCRYLLARIASNTLGSTSVEVSPSSQPSATSRSKPAHDFSAAGLGQLRDQGLGPQRRGPGVPTAAEQTEAKPDGQHSKAAPATGSDIGVYVNLSALVRLANALQHSAGQDLERDGGGDDGANGTAHARASRTRCSAPSSAHN
jgi:hypothetical protein